MTVDKMICRGDNYCEGKDGSWRRGEGQTLEQLGRHHVIEQGIMQRHGSGLTIVMIGGSDDVDVTVVIFMRLWFWLLLL